MVGGGSGGHVTPVAAVIREIKRQHPKSEIRFWCDRKFAPQAKAVISHLDYKIPVKTISAGKLRRYNHLTLLQQITWPSLVLANFVDSFKVLAGFIESFFRLIFWRPDVVFTKGGYVCLPVGIAAKLLRIPLVIHDSDAHPGLTNRILAKWATAIATGAPLEFYSYPKAISKYVGIPISKEFRIFSESEKKSAKVEWGMSEKFPLVVVTGGGLGAMRINDAVATTLDELLKFCSVILVSGSAQYDELRALTPPDSDRYQLHSFVSKDMAGLLGAADVVVARSGATTILELAALAKPTVLIPNAKLTGGHQIKNTAVYLEKEAVIAIDEEQMINDSTIFVNTIKSLISDPEKAKKIANSLSTFAKPNAASEVADMILGSIKQ